MEFLMTYGWAILVVLVAIGALVYFGVLSPSKFLPDTCSIGQGFACNGFKVTATTVQLIAVNSIGDDLSAVAVAISGCTASAEASGDDTWNDGATLGGTDGITLTACTNGAAGASFKEDVTLTYTTSTGISHTVTGTLVTEIE